VARGWQRLRNVSNGAGGMLNLNWWWCATTELWKGWSVITDDE